MYKISRGKFLKVSALGLAASIAPISVWDISSKENKEFDEKFFKGLLRNNDVSASRYLKSHKNLRRHSQGRPLTKEFAILAASYYQPDSKYYKSKTVSVRLENILSELLLLQYPNGTLDSGGNKQSPPDTAFILENLCPAAFLIKQNGFTGLENIRDRLNKFLLKAGEALKTGGLHTPNHRWAVSSSLARLYAIYNDESYVRRIDEWLAEGIYINEDDQYSERSRNYSVVVNNSFITIGRILNRPSLFEIVKRNLYANYYYMETNGDLVTLDSRRQDQNYPVPMTVYYLCYRYLANYYNDEILGAIAKKIETFDNFERIILSRSLIFVLENSLIGKEIHTNKKLPADYSKLFALSGLARIRRGNVTASIFGGDDKPLIISSGRSCNPDFFTLRKGSAIIEYARLSTSFFNTGYFRSDGVKKEGNKYTLAEKKEAYYYLPMPESKRDKSGDYKLSQSLDRRFWSKMDFESRPKTTITLETMIIIVEEKGTFKMDFELHGAENTEVTLELCFRLNGELEGVTPAFGNKDFFLKSGYGKYLFGTDMIEFGPGKFEHDKVHRLDGEVYSTHLGSIKGKGLHVYLTGYVPFKHSITIR
jgi:hypothetical protein